MVVNANTFHAAKGRLPEKREESATKRHAANVSAASNDDTPPGDEASGSDLYALRCGMKGRQQARLTSKENRGQASHSPLSPH